MATWSEEWTQWAQRHFPALRLGGFTLTSRESDEYNCIAWAALDTTRWWWPSPDAYWPAEAPQAETVESFIVAFRRLGFEPCDLSEALEAGVEKVAIYAKADGRPTHMARQTETGEWTSKLGEGCDIEHHSLNGVEGVTYGRVVQMLKRPR